MPTTINGTTGIDQIQDNTVTGPKVVSGSIQQSDLGANVAGNGPCFSAYQNIGQSIGTSAFVKVQLQIEEFDTDAAFSAGAMITNVDLTNRFTPKIAGYYQVTGSIYLNSPTNESLAVVYKNGVEYKRGMDINSATKALSVTCLVYLNGTTDYVELFVYQASGGTLNSTQGMANTYFQGFLARAA